MEIAKVRYILAIFMLSHLGTASATSCPANFSMQTGFCLHVRPQQSGGVQLNWCEAQAFCNSIGGRLLSTVSTLIALQPVLPILGDTERYLLGFTDMLKEAGRSRTGWLSTDDGELPVDSVINAMWYLNKPDNKTADDDCLQLYSDHYSSPLTLLDGVCSNSYGFICEPGPQSYSKAFSIFRKTALPSQPPEAAPFYCRGEEVTAKNRFHCLSLCAVNPLCKASLFNRASLACRQILHGDAAVEAAIETDANWEKFSR